MCSFGSNKCREVWNLNYIGKFMDSVALGVLVKNTIHIDLKLEINKNLSIWKLCWWISKLFADYVHYVLLATARILYWLPCQILSLDDVFLGFLRCYLSQEFLPISPVSMIHKIQCFRLIMYWFSFWCSFSNEDVSNIRWIFHLWDNWLLYFVLIFVAILTCLQVQGFPPSFGDGISATTRHEVALFAQNSLSMQILERSGR